jgi:hypothetical protein
MAASSCSTSIASARTARAGKGQHSKFVDDSGGGDFVASLLPPRQDAPKRAKSASSESAFKFDVDEMVIAHDVKYPGQEFQAKVLNISVLFLLLGCTTIAHFCLRPIVISSPRFLVLDCSTTSSACTL